MFSKISLFISMLLLCIPQLAFSQNVEPRLVDEVLLAAINQDEPRVHELKSRLDLQKKPEHGNRKEARLLNERGLRELRAENHLDAIDLLTRAVNLDSADAELHNNLGHALLLADQPEDAIAPLKAALFISPGRSSAWLNLGEAWVAVGEPERAVAAWRLAYLFSNNKAKTLEFLAKLAQNPSLPDGVAATLATVIAAPHFVGKQGAQPGQAALADSQGAMPQATAPSVAAPVSADNAFGVTPADGKRQPMSMATSDFEAMAPPSTDPVRASAPSSVSSPAPVSFEQEGTDWSTRLFKLLSIGAIFSLVALVVGAASNRVVVFYDWVDFFQTLMILVSLIVGGFIWIIFFYKDQLMSVVVAVATTLCCLFYCWKTMRASIQHNTSLYLGVFVGLFKIFSSSILALLVLGKVGDVTSKSSSIGLRISSIIFLGILSYIAYVLVNGERVEKKRIA